MSNDPVSMVRKIYGSEVQYVPLIRADWEEHKREGRRAVYNCSYCGAGTAIRSRYCPGCGAKMEVDDDGV